MSGVHFPVSCLAVTLVLVSVLPTTVDGSLLRRYRTGSYGNAKEVSEQQNYRVIDKTVQGSRLFPKLMRYQKPRPSTLQSSPPSTPAAPLLARLIQGSSGKAASVKPDESTRTAEAIIPLLWPSGNGLPAVDVDSASSLDGEVIETANAEPSTSWLELIKAVLGLMGRSEATPAAATDDKQTPKEIIKSRIRDIMTKLRGRQSSSVSVTLPTDHENTTDSTASQLMMTILRQLLGVQQTQETTNDSQQTQDSSADNQQKETVGDEDTSSDSISRRRMFDLMALIKKLMNDEGHPSEAQGDSDNTKVVVEIPEPMRSEAAIGALVRWLSALHRLRKSSNSPSHFASIIIDLLSKMASARSSTTTTSSIPSATKWLSFINRPKFSISSSSISSPTTVPTLLSKLFTQGSPSTTSSSDSYYLLKSPGDIKDFRSPIRSSSPAPLLSKLLKSFEKPKVLQSKSITTSSPPIIRWLGPLRSSTGSSPPSAAAPQRAYLRELLSNIQ